MSRRIVVMIVGVIVSAPVSAADTIAGQPGSSGSLPPGTAAPGGTSGSGSHSTTTVGAADDQAVKNAAEVAKFVLDQEKSTQWTEHEGRKGFCRVDDGNGTVDLTFRADGTLHCKALPLAEGYKVHVWILTMKKYAAHPATGTEGKKASTYLVKATPGADLANGLAIRGAADDVKAALAFLEKLGTKASDVESPTWSDEGEFGPWHAADVSIQVDLKVAALTQTTKLKIAPLYNVNLAIAAVGGPGVTEYSVANGAIQEQKPSVAIDYYLGLEVFPLAWHRNGLGDLTMGRYFESAYERWWERIPLIAGISLSHPTEKVFVGTGFHVLDGIGLVAGWQPRQVQKLKAGFAPGQAVQGTSAPVEQEWDLTGWGVGIVVDAAVAKTVTSAFK